MIDITNRALCNAEAERYTIGAIIQYENARRFIDTLSPDDFTDPLRRRLYLTIRAMADRKEPIDMLTIDKHLGADVEIMTEMVECTRIAVSGAYSNSYIALIKDATKRRTVIEIAERIAADMAESTADPADVIESARNRLRMMASDRSEWVDMRGMIHSTYHWLERRAKGEERPIQSGITDLDTLIGGFFPGELTVIGARPSAGKSQMGMNIALAAGKRGFKVAFASLEMVQEQYGQRVLSREADINGMRIRNGVIGEPEWEKIVNAMGPVSALPISFLFDVYQIEDIVSSVQRKADNGEIDMLVVDYLQLVQSRKKFKPEQDRLRVGYVSKALKTITKELKIPVVALAQVGRTAEGSMPCKADLKDSGDIEQDADNIIFLYRPGDSGDKWVHANDRGLYESLQDKGMQYVAVNVDKQRQGQTGAVFLISDPTRMRYLGIDRKGGTQA